MFNSASVNSLPSNVENTIIAHIHVEEPLSDVLFAIRLSGAEHSVVVGADHNISLAEGELVPLGSVAKGNVGQVPVCDTTGVKQVLMWERLEALRETTNDFEHSDRFIANGSPGWKLPVEDSDRWTTYNFEVEEHHTYIADGVRVHNRSDLLAGILQDIYADGEMSAAEAERLDAYREFGFDAGNDARVSWTDSEGHPHWGSNEAYRTALENGDVEAGSGSGGADAELSSQEREARNREREDRLREYEERYGEKAKADPLIIDLDGDGIEVNVDANISFDFDGDGFLEQGAWAAADDGFLVIDLNADGSRGAGDGVIDQARELAFSLWGEDGMTDLQALAQARDADGNLIFDTNADGVLDASDAVWSELRIWQDSNQNGITDDGELMTLDELGFTQINLTYDPDEDGNVADYSDTSDDITIFGTSLLGLASYVRLDSDGNPETISGGVGDVALSYNTLGWRKVGTAAGYNIEFESGDTYKYAVMDDAGTDLDLNIEWFDGVAGNDASNVLTADGVTKSVQIAGGGGDDTITGGFGDDMLSGDDGNDSLIGGEGNDMLFYDSSDTVDGGLGYDVAIATDDGAVSIDLLSQGLEGVQAGGGNDTLDGSSSTQEQLSISGGGGDDIITGGAAEDVLSGDDGNDVVAGGAGSDVITGGAGDDNLSGETGDDVILGGAGADTLDGGQHDDRLMGGTDNDLLLGDVGDDYLDGGDGDDSLEGGEHDDVLRGGDGNDTLNGRIRRRCAARWRRQ